MHHTGQLQLHPAASHTGSCCRCAPTQIHWTPRTHSAWMISMSLQLAKQHVGSSYVVSASLNIQHSRATSTACSLPCKDTVLIDYFHLLTGSRSASNCMDLKFKTMFGLLTYKFPCMTGTTSRIHMSSSPAAVKKKNTGLACWTSNDHLNS